MTRDWVRLLRRASRKPPRVLFQRARRELAAEGRRWTAPLRARRFDEAKLLQALDARSLDTLWAGLGSRPYPGLRGDASQFEALCPGGAQHVLQAAEDALQHRVDLLGSGQVSLGEFIDWHHDFKSGYGWSSEYFTSIDYNNFERLSDVKIPWELSRVQWLLPLGQAWMLTGDERYAVSARQVLEQWIESNPYCMGVNWACTMEVALRVLSWTWLFHALHQSRAWSDPGFRSRFLRTLWLHAEFTEQNLERSEVNGNHFTADSAGLVFAGLFFGQGSDPERWQRVGWDLLCEELPRQVYPDGVDFEASVAYHRLVTELFLFPALYRQTHRLAVPTWYRDRLRAMGRFVEAYTRADGSCPWWGDADDARAIPLGRQGANDHRYLLGLVGLGLDDSALASAFSGPRDEVFWILGPRAAASLPGNGRETQAVSSVAFPKGGFYIMRSLVDHVFIDCGPIGLAGRGGHGHNDALSFEAVLNGVHVIGDCGAYVYTASREWRDRFRSTGFHNTPSVDGEEQNRFVHPLEIWSLHNDTRAEVIQWSTGVEADVFQGKHRGYERLPQPVTVVRTLRLDKRRHAVAIRDEFLGEGFHEIRIPFHLAPGVHPTLESPGRWILQSGGKRFELVHPPADYVSQVCDSWASPSYGVKLPIKEIVLTRNGALVPSVVVIGPEAEVASELDAMGYLPKVATS